LTVQDKTQKKSQIQDSYTKATVDNDRNLSQRGLQRSSIASNTANLIDNTKEQNLNDANQQFVDLIKNIDIQIGGLEQKRNKALQDFDIVYAAKLTQDINALMAEREKNNQAALKYNNNLNTQMQKDYQQYLKNQQDHDKQIDDAKAKQLLQRQQQLFEEARIVLKSMPITEARQKIENDPIFANLPYYMRTTLYNQFGLPQ